MTLRKKLGWCFASTSMLTAALGLCAWISVSRTASELDNAVHLTAKKVALASDMNYSLLTLRFSERGLELFASIHGDEKVAVNKRALETAKVRISADILELRPLMQTDREIQLLDATESSIKQWEAGQVPVYQLVLLNRINDAIQLDMNTLVAPGTAATKSIGDLGYEQQISYNLAVEQANSIVHESQILILSILVLSMTMAGFAALVLNRSTKELRLMAANIGSGADQISSAASQVSASSQSLAQGSSEQAASIEETSASSEEINSMARRNTDNSHSMAELMDQSHGTFETTNRQLEDMVVSMEQISQSSGKISKIIKVIDEIAFQTNILALNAAVEAARAGEAGLGFAIVADEVRNLAQRSAMAAKDTTALIEDSIAKSVTGKSKVDDVARAIRAVTADSGRIKSLVDEVNSGSKEQSRGLDQIAKAISQMERVTQTTAANAEQTAAAAEELNAQSNVLKDEAARLNAMVGV